MGFRLPSSLSSNRIHMIVREIIGHPLKVFTKIKKPEMWKIRDCVLLLPLAGTWQRRGGGMKNHTRGDDNQKQSYTRRSLHTHFCGEKDQRSLMGDRMSISHRAQNKVTTGRFTSWLHIHATKRNDRNRPPEMHSRGRSRRTGQKLMRDIEFLCVKRSLHAHFQSTRERIFTCDAP